MKRLWLPLQMDGLYSAIASAAAGATDLATSAASAASRTAAQTAASTPTAMESIIQTGAASAAAALFGSTDAVTPPKTLALGAAWRDALCPNHRERTDLPGGARSEGLAMVVAACARIESTSAPRRAALQRLVRLAASEYKNSSHAFSINNSQVAPLAGWRRPSGALGASLASKARDLKPGDGFVAPIAAGYCAARRKGDGSYDVAVSGVGAEALAWHEYRVGQDGAVERAALAVVENCDAERIVSAAAWANLAAAPAGAKRGQSDAVATCAKIKISRRPLLKHRVDLRAIDAFTHRSPQRGRATPRRYLSSRRAGGPPTAAASRPSSLRRARNEPTRPP